MPEGTRRGRPIFGHWSLLLIMSVPAIITPGKSLCKTPLFSSANEINHEECGESGVMSYNIGWFVWHTEHSYTQYLGCRSTYLNTQNVQPFMQLGGQVIHYTGIPRNLLSIFKLRQIFALFSWQAVTSGKVNQLPHALLLGTYPPVPCKLALACEDEKT